MPAPKPATMAAEPRRSRPDGTLPTTGPDGKPLKQAGAIRVLYAMAAGLEEKRQPEAKARADRGHPPWHGIAPPTRHPFLQEAHAANADAMMRISARAAEELVNLVSRVVAWMKKPPPFATAPVTDSQPDPGNRPSPRWSSGITMEMRMEPTRQ